MNTTDKSRADALTRCPLLVDEDCLYGPYGMNGETVCKFCGFAKGAERPVEQHEAAPADMKAALQWTAGTLQEIVSGRWKGAKESDKVSIGSVTKTISQVLDMADAALGHAPQPESVAAAAEEQAPTCTCQRIGDWDGRSHHPLCEQARASSPNAAGAEGLAAIQAVLREIDPKWRERGEFGVKPHEQIIAAIRDLAAPAQPAEPVAIHQVRDKGSLKWQDIEPISLSMFADEERYVQRVVYAAPVQASGIIDAIAAHWDGRLFETNSCYADIGKEIRAAWARLTVAAPPPPAPASAPVDVEAMLRACVPGGDIVDPQLVCDNIREWIDEHRAQASAPVGLTAEQREAVDFAVKWFDQSVLPDTPYAGYSKVLHALLEGAKQ
ncbi:hypothetical protein [Burkholderia ambifaria]|uniref:hypothetical protein n=1 Tax=Burkholderia ambifaria TaxID=152480 RepID=UPI001B9E0D81|nr:hypothetical protein [Burkholderia ambifaria]MBR7929441.1 hypothetical protein [Burkholderia ambifaria]